MNVNGLADHKWPIITGLLDAGVFDYLFLLETWYMGYNTQYKDRRVVAFTPIPREPPRGSRYYGGIMLLCTPRARE